MFKQHLVRLRFSLIFIFLFLSVIGFGQDKEKSANVVRARVVDSQTKKAVSFARIINKSRHTGVFSDTLGVFSIGAHPADTLYISSIGYFSASITISDSLFKQTKIPIISLVEHVYELGMVDVNYFGTYQQFKYKVLHLQLPTNTTQQVMEAIQKQIQLIPNHPLQAQASIPLGSPVTALYNLFSKEGKSHRKFLKVLEEEKKRGEDERSLSIVSRKYNSEIVAEATGLSGDMLKQFMLFCKPDNMFIVVSNDYEIYKQILDCYTSFKHDMIDHSFPVK